ncbi:endonuclease III [Hippea jasoniae]|uniref:endonuclease III n=1 Tax=Hippea jasoniae TaxID=944479 RepID=UPI0006901A26|nr:endonuclease III [Hippea jasoniae]
MDEIIQRILKNYPEPKLELNFNNPFELLVALILSARCTDKRTNIITEKLFKIYPTAKEMANAEFDDLNNLISSCSMHNTKAKNLIALSKALCEKHNCEVPDSFENLVKLPGVGAKTANILLAFGFGKPAVGVDTHVARVAYRIGLSENKKPEIVEDAIKQTVNKENRVAFFSGLILHGRHICKAKKPLCDKCFLNDICPRRID